jgi:hypothetical protein
MFRVIHTEKSCTWIGIIVEWLDNDVILWKRLVMWNGFNWLKKV